MFDKHLLNMLFLELADPAWIPQLAGDTQVLAAAHHGVGLAALGSGGDAFGVEVVLFAAGDGDKPSTKKEIKVSIREVLCRVVKGGIGTVHAQQAHTPSSPTSA